jgi:hypothetical protein
MATATAGAITVAEAITMDGAIITIGETSTKKTSFSLAAFSFWSQSVSAAHGHTQEPPRFPSTARAVAFCGEVRCVERCSNAVPLLVWAHCLN